MHHIGMVTPPYAGHVNTMIVLGGELHRRGHRVSIISTPDVRERVLRHGLEFQPVGAREYPLGSLERFTEKQGTLSGLPAIRFIMKDLVRIAQAHERELCDVVTGNDMNALMVDQIQPMGGTVAQHLDIPFVSVCSLLPLNIDPMVPPWVMPWSYGVSTAARIRNAIGNRATEFVGASLTAANNRQRERWGLKRGSSQDWFSDLAQISQQPDFFDFPRERMPECFHHVGPLHDYNGAGGGAGAIPFPWDALDNDRPLIYASMGTLQNRMTRIFRMIAEACVGRDAQLVIALGRQGAPIPADLPGNPLVVDYAPQLELLKRASLVICHGGANTVLESMANGVPMVLMPVATDQPGVAARAKRLGVAEFIPVGKVTARRLRAAIDTVWSDPAYRENAQKYQNAIGEINAVSRAADIAEEAFRTRRPIIRTGA